MVQDTRIMDPHTQHSRPDSDTLPQSAKNLLRNEHDTQPALLSVAESITDNLPSGHRSAPASFRTSIASHLSTDIKHDVMVEYLYQQACKLMWIGSGVGETEGVLLRKSKGVYLTSPPELRQSSFADYCADLNLQVRSQAQSSVVDLTSFRSQ
jgi:hypothetical protein